MYLSFSGKSIYQIVTQTFLKDLDKRITSVPYNDKDGGKEKCHV